MTAEDWESARLELMGAARARGIPEDFANALVKNLGGPGSLRRMAGYLRQPGHLTPEMIADEMVAIVEQRERWVQKKMSEHANASITRYYNRPNLEG